VGSTAVAASATLSAVPSSASSDVTPASVMPQGMIRPNEPRSFDTLKAEPVLGGATADPDPDGDDLAFGT
jgi:hypothetical protein